MTALLAALAAVAGCDCTDVLLERLGYICPFVGDIPGLYSGGLPAGWETQVLPVPGEGLEEWEVPLHLLLRADGWLVSEWLDPYAGMIEMEAVLETGEPAGFDSLFASAREVLRGFVRACEPSGEPGGVPTLGTASELLEFVRIPPDSTKRLSGCDLWIYRPSPGRIEIGCRIACFYGSAPASASAIPDSDHLGMLSRFDLRELATARLVRIVEEDGLFEWAGEDGLSYSSTIPEGAEADPLRSMVEITVREVHDTHGDPMTAPAVGHFLVQPVVGGVMMLDPTTGDRVTIRD